MAVPAACCALTLVLHSPLAPKCWEGPGGMDGLSPCMPRGSWLPVAQINLSGVSPPLPARALGHPLCAALLLSRAPRLPSHPFVHPHGVAEPSHPLAFL